MTTIKIIVPAGKAPLYERYGGQIHPQPAYFELRPEERVAEFDWNANVGGGTSMDAWHGLVRRYRVPATLSREGCENLAETLQPLLQRVVDGFEEVWNGSNHVGRLTQDASHAEYEIESVIDRLNQTDGDHVQVWDAAEWLAGQGSGEEAARDLGVTADSTDEEIAALAQRLEEEADLDGVVLYGDLAREIRDIRDAMKETTEEEAL